ncbi:glycosyltransferase family 4 protein [Fictibacillus norfolkensis]|uniref:Glycosyltransferase family 4 protein n=1 Tax=Fictibacillus norfolkensis TaxID=2762233 RepID=A0ABR8SI15_9BACL|nr:glycosyltransferase family 4 protein [Fictibacillus norfolkensis]MBD7962759.1 glycosyltransferase family 4 protein [Fictibacillus norfolkensis]
MSPFKIGYIDGKASRINERVIDQQWISYLSEHIETIGIPPLRIMRLFKPSLDRFVENLPVSLDILGERLQQLISTYEIKALYVNMPFLVPYLMMARNLYKIDLSIVCIAHSVGSEYWCKQWMTIAPWISEKDVLLVSTESSKRALENISPVYKNAVLTPLCIDNEKIETLARPAGGSMNLLSIGRIENIKNIHILISIFKKILIENKNIHLYIAGDYTGPSKEEINTYKHLLNTLVDDDLKNHIYFVGAIDNEEKHTYFRHADLLVNLSTDPGETFGFNLIEAKVYGLPVVCTAWNGFKELISHGSDGYLIDCDWVDETPKIDEQHAVHLIQTLLGDDELQKEFSKHSKESASRYNYKTVMPKIIEAVSKAVSTEIHDSINFQTGFKKVKDLDDMYHLKHLKNTGLLEETPLSLLVSESTTDVYQWLTKIKPCISHFASSEVLRKVQV